MDILSPIVVFMHDSVLVSTVMKIIFNKLTW